MREHNTEKLQETLQLLEAIQDSTTVANLVVAADYSIVSFNRRFREFLLKYWSHEVSIGESSINFIHPDNLADFKREFAQALDGKVIRAEHSFTTLNGRTMWIAVEYHPVKVMTDQGSKVALSFRNVTRERLYEKKITAQNKKLKEVAFVSAHQLRGPITSLLGLTNLLSDQPADWNDTKLYLAKIKELSDKIDIEIRSLVGKTEEI
ncbi:PAS domain S-box protein [Reichenbachiella carrageenanivorans]|uniref:histidine kinase n=1 Tax=Reichenbachiella carrageenanivorans TaxID=2979869 RepID=A0ABY6D679_9BACT|nr:PAS domain S-box protein [Reichenbachiella carrageenanivorans]UXX81120.1 PAS domain S-box protein [Reichenbachiella carrageenanivorans]